MITKIIGDKEYQLTIEQDGRINPRENSNLGKILYSHRRYILGDYKLINYGNSLYQDFLIYINKEYDIIEIESLYSLSENEIVSIEKFIDDNIVYLPVYLLDHSGVSIQTFPFACLWDSGELGYIYSHKDNIEKDLILKDGEDGIEKLKAILKAEVDYYDRYIRGDFIGFNIKLRSFIEKDGKKYYGEWEEEDSCGGLDKPIDILEYNSIFTKEEIESCEINY